MSEDLNRVFLLLGEISAKQDLMSDDIKAVKEKVGEHDKLKNRIFGIAIGVAAVAGGTFNVVLRKLGFDV